MSSNLNGATTASTKTFVTALVLNGIIAAVEIAVFTCARRYFRLVYEPRSLSVFESKRQPPLSPRFFGWLGSVFSSDYRKIKNINGLDCYFYVRFLRMMVRLMLPIWLISWAILLPITSVQTGVSGHSGLDMFIFGNIGVTDQDRYYAHLILTWIFTIWTWWNIKHEMAHYVRVRQHYLASSSHSSTAQACTVLVTGIPPKYLSESALTRLFSHLPGGVRKVWINRDLGDMPDLLSQRLEVCQMLESAETSLLNTAITRNNKKLKKAKSGDGDKDTSDTALAKPVSDPETRKTLIEELVPKGDRPSHRLPLLSFLPSLPLLGKKVDTIDWARDRVHELNAQLAQKREILAGDIARTTAAEAQITPRMHRIGTKKLNIAIPAVPVSVPLVKPRAVVDFSDQTYPPANGAFILFNEQIAAHMAAQMLIHHQEYRMSDAMKYVEVAPEDVIWNNLVMNPYERRVRLVFSWSATIGLIIVWALPVAFVGFISNIHSLCTTYHWLAWICTIPTIIISIVQGFLPAVLLAVLFMLVPIIMRMLARMEGIPQRTGVELSLMDRFFLFQVVNGFLVVTLSAGIIAALPGLVHDPSSVPTLLAQNLPKSSTFFLTFIILQGLTGTAGGFLQAVPLALYYVKITLLGSTPRSVYKIKYSPRTSDWGTLFPSTTLLVVITFGYSIISPVINGLAFAAFFLFYMLYKYLFTWVNDQPLSSDTGGLFFPKALQHLFVGLYVQQVCLCALFFLAQGSTHKPSAIPEGALMIVLILFTAFFQNTILNSYGPLLKYLPLTLVDRSPSGQTVVEQEAPQDADAQQALLSTSDIKATDYAKASTSGPDQQPSEATSPPHPDGTDDERAETSSFTEESSSSAWVRPKEAEGPIDFSHPAAVEAQRMIWLPKDHLGLVHEIEQDLASQDILYSTDGAEMNDEGHVEVTLAPPEEARRVGAMPPPSPGEGEGDEIRELSKSSV
jgi:hypothetical protein